jgi:hypothetical protein
MTSAPDAETGLRAALMTGCTNPEHDHVTPYRALILREATARMRSFADTAAQLGPLTSYAQGAQAMAKMLADMTDPDRP